MLHESYESSNNIEPGLRQGYPQSSGAAIDPTEALLEARQVCKDFQAPGGTIRVDTRIKVSRSPWSVRSVILENDTEIQEGPFAPIQQEFDASTADPEGLADLRLDFARQALAGHLARCKQVERALSGKTPSPGKSKGPMIAVVVALLLVIGGAAGFLLWKQSKKSNLAEKGNTLPATAPEQVPGSVPSQSTLTPTVPPAVAVEPNPVIIKQVVPAPPIGSNLPPQTVQPAAGSTPRRAPQIADKAPRPSALARKERTSAPELSQDSSSKRASGREIIRAIEPAGYQLGRIRTGARAYVDDLTTFADVPAELHNLQCIRTSNAARTGKNILTFQLDSGARVYVGHDQRIRKKPQWLQTFSPTGRHLALLESRGANKADGINHLAQAYVDSSELIAPGSSGKIVQNVQRLQAAADTAEEVRALVQGGENGLAIFDLYARDYSAGPVTLGANTEWSSFTRFVRAGLPKKMGMYVVCVQPTR